MTPFYRLLAAALLSLAVPPLAAAPAPRLKLADLPAPVQAKVQAEAPDLAVQRIYKGYEKGKQEPSYFVVLVGAEEKAVLRLDPQGKLLRRDSGKLEPRDRLRLPARDEEPYGTFEGKVPCADCERIKVSLTLLTKAGQPSRYVLERVGVGKGSTVEMQTGAWARRPKKGETPALAEIELKGEAPKGWTRYLEVGPDLLLPRDEAGDLKVGDSAHSFTLSRTE